jgi:hypothetical protein
MSRLLRLYPRAWRDRYESEMLALLEDRSPGPMELLDLVRGAFRSHLDCRLRDREGRVPTPPRHLHPLALVLMGLAGLISGYALVVGVISIAQPDPDRWAGWGPVGFTIAASVVLAGLVLAVWRPTLGMLLGASGTVLALAAAPWLFAFVIPVGLATALPIVGEKRMGARGPSRPAQV